MNVLFRYRDRETEKTAFKRFLYMLCLTQRARQISGERKDYSNRLCKKIWIPTLNHAQNLIPNGLKI